MAMIKLHVFPPSPRAAKVIALVEHLKLDCQFQIVDLFEGEQHRPEFAELNPNERMPVLEEDGFVLWESNAILQYLASKRPELGLWPADARDQADVSRWCNWESAHWTPACAIVAFERVVKKLSGQGEPNEAEAARGEEQIRRFAAVLDAHLRGRKWLLGDALTIADFTVGAPLLMAEAGRYPIADRAEIARWYRALGTLPAWKKVIVPPLS
jgi:glutathione S-transferase